MRKNRSLGRWVLAAGVSTLVAIGCATTPIEETIIIQADSGKTDAAKRSDTNKPTDTNQFVADTNSAADTNAERADTADAGLPAGEPFDPTPELAEGSTCPTENDVIERRCGKCGTQQALCTKAADTRLKIGTYGTCRNENTAVNSCLPNAQRMGASCGVCGEMLEICDPDNSCVWSEVSCKGEVSGGCTAGDVRYLSLSCSGDMVSRQVCGDSCIWSSPEACATRGPDELVLPATAGITAKKESTLWGAATPAPTPGACPTTLTAASGNTNYTKIHNGRATDIRVNLWVSKPTGGVLPDMLLTTYNGATIPTAEADRLACAPSVVNAPMGFSGSGAVTVPAGGDILVLSTTKTNGAANAPFVLNAQIEGPVDVPASAGATVTGDYVVRGGGSMMPRGESGTCPVGIRSGLYPFTFITLKNTEASPVTVNVGAQVPSSGGDLMMAVYATEPTDTTVNACIGTSTDYCSISPAFTNDACVPDTVVPANGHVTVMVSNFYAGATTDHSFTLKVTRK